MSLTDSDLKLPAERVDPETEPGKTKYRALLHNLQANILKPHGRDFASHIFLRFTAPPAQVKEWIRTVVAPKVTRAEAQYNRPLDASGNRVDGGLVVGFCLSADGYRHLKLRTNPFDDVFSDGMKQGGGEDLPVSQWDAPFRGEIHALVSLADDSLDTVETQADALVAGLAGIAQVLTTERGHRLKRNGADVEHFGYRDGISQPLFTAPDLAKYRESRGVDQWNPGAPLKQVLLDDPHTTAVDAFGSYLVFRKLAQDVAGFEGMVRELAGQLPDIATDRNHREDLAGALVVGRFKDGTPVLLDDHPVGGEVNNFNYKEDGSEFRCPFHAHIRKANPRGTTPLTSPTSERGRRIARRGIPYGPPMPHVSDPRPEIPVSTDRSEARGLLFLCFQENIGTQFRFLQTTWIDNNKFPTNVISIPAHPNTGDDPLIGQGSKDEPQAWPKRWDDPRGPGLKFDKGMQRFDFKSAVRLRGGEYFFAPSLPFLETLA